MNGRHNVYIVDLRDVDKIILKLDESGLEIFKIVLKPVEADKNYVRYKVDTVLDKIIFKGSKKTLAKFIAYLVKRIREDPELWKMFIDEYMPRDYIDYQLFYNPYSRLDEV